MNVLTQIYQITDSTLIFFFRLPDIPILGYYLGCLILSGICVVLGQITIAVAFFWNQRFIDRDNREMVRMHNLSVRALMLKDKQAYKKCNKAANDAFGKVFFSQIALSISSLWPVPFAAGWLQTRFQDVAFELPVSLPGIGDQVGYLFTFLPIYILAYILFGWIKGHLPYFRTVVKRLEKYDTEGEEKMIRMSELARTAQNQ